MSDSCFFDSNTLIYRFSPHESRKQQRAQRLSRQVVADGKGVISYQVIQEVRNVGLKGASARLTLGEANLLMQSLAADFAVVPWSLAIVERGLQVKGRYGFGWYDSLIVAAALEWKCDVLYTEDLHNGQRIEGLTVVNPFL